MLIGKTINRLRGEKKMTLAELSKKSGVALATLSRIENGKMTGTLASHMKIAEALEISLPELYKDLALSKKVVEVRTKKAKTEVFARNKRTTSEILASKVSNKKMMPILIRIAKNESTHKEETKPGVEKFIYILAGKVEANIGQEKYNLNKWDSLYFESSIPHYFKNTSTSDSCIICVICPPIL